MSDISDALEAAAQGPARVTVDGVTVEAKAAADAIEADKYIQAKAAQSKNHLGLSFRTLVPGGCG